MEILQSLNELIFPSRCIACGELGLSICSRCRRGWNPHIYITEVRNSITPPLKVISSINYSKVAQQIILAAKEDHIKSADELLTQALSHSLQFLLRNNWVDYLIPIPSRRTVVRKRGRQFIQEIASPVSAQFSIPMATPLIHRRKVRDQSGLNVDQRRNNLAGAFVVEEEHGLIGSAVLVDALVTTGATLLEAARALRYAGIQVIGAVTAAVAQPLR